MKRPKNRVRVYLLLSIVIAAMLAASACTSKASGGGSANAEGGKERTLTIGVKTGLETFDFQNTNSGFNQSMLVNIFDTLFVRDAQGEIKPKLVEKYEQISDDTWRFTLKDGIKFHNGDSLTAKDIKFSLERVAKDQTLSQYSNFKQIKEIKIADDSHFDIITNGPDPVLLNQLASQPASILPKDYIEKATWDEFLKKPVGSGLYQVVENRKDDRLVIKKFDGYFEPVDTDWDEVIFRAIPETSTRVGELLAGGIDLAELIPPSEWERIKNNAGTSVLESDSTRVVAWQVRMTPGTPTADVRVRQAIDYAIDDKGIADRIFKGTVTPMRTLVMPGMNGADESLYNTYRYDPAKAKELLKEAGYENGGPEITLQAPQGRYVLDSDVTQLVAGMLEQVGIKVKIELMENSRYQEISSNGKNKELIMLGRVNSLFDALNSMKYFDSNNGKGQMDYSNPKVDELLKKAETNMDLQERAEQYKQIQQIIAEELPYITMYNEKYFTGVDDRIDFKPRMDQMYFVQDIKKK